MSEPFSLDLTNACKHLQLHDPHMAVLISKYGAPTIAPHTNYYEELVSSIISQQLSVKAAQTIWNRFIGLFDGATPTPQQIIATDIEQIRGVGASYAKAKYIKDLAQHIEDGSLDLNHIASLDNATIISQLTNVKGIGEWSAHMFMIFSLGRLDILPYGDLGIKKSAQKLYNLNEMPSKKQLEELASRNQWPPYQSVAAWYLWKYLDNEPKAQAD